MSTPRPPPCHDDAGAPRIVVLGSLNMDLVVRVPRAPSAGETLQGRSVGTVPGGKGANQAVSCARQGARVRMIGCVGADAHGQALRHALEADGIDTGALQTVSDEATGNAVILVEDSGQNRIVIVPGANARVRVEPAVLAPLLQNAAFFVTQLETPLAEVLTAIETAHAAGCRVLLNPSPVQALPATLWPRIDTLVLNEVEARALSDLPADSPDDAARAGQALRARGVNRVVVTLGAGGAVAVDAHGARHQPALPVQAVDTTAAGDTFLGALAVALAQAQPFDAAVGLGIRAAALCIQQPGAQPSIPRRDDLARAAPLSPTPSR